MSKSSDGGKLLRKNKLMCEAAMKKKQLINMQKQNSSMVFAQKSAYTKEFTVIIS